MRSLVLLLGVFFVQEAQPSYFVPVQTDFVFPLTFSKSTNELCKKNIETFIQHLENDTLWAYRMWDSSAKLSLGLTEGSPYQLGYYEECVSIKVPFTTQYCLAEVIYDIKFNGTISDKFSLAYDPYASVYSKLQYTDDPNRVPRNRVHWGLCVPESCSAEDVHLALQKYLDGLENPNIEKYDVFLKAEDCDNGTSDRSLTAGDFVFCSVLILILATVLVSTYFDYHHTYVYTSDPDSIQHGKTAQLLLCFSAIKSFSDLLKRDSDNDSLAVLYGARLLMTYSIVFGHSIVIMLTGPISNFENIEQVNRSILSTPICRGEVIVDLFFLLSGLLATYGYLVQSEKKKVNPLKSIILRYFRLVPVFMLVTIFYATVFYKIGSGPLWNKIVGAEQKYCQKNWWTNLLLVNNYIDVENLCILQGWYVPVDFQLFILSILLNLLIIKESRMYWSIFGIIFCASIFTPFAITYFGEKDPFYFIFNDFFSKIRSNDVFQTIYVPTYTRASPHLIGIIFGYIYYKLKDSGYKLNFLPSVVIFAMAVGIALCTLLTGVVFFNPYIPYNILEGSMYGAFHRPAFALAAGIAIFIFSYGSLPGVKAFFSWSPFIPLAKLTFSLYMVHMGLQLAKAGSGSTAQYISVWSSISNCIVEATVSHLIAFFLFIFVENPFLKLAKKLLSYNFQKKKS